jgi:hypothetical protein
MKHVKIKNTTRIWRLQFLKYSKCYYEYTTLQRCDMKDICRPVWVVLPDTNPFNPIWGAMVCGVLYVSSIHRSDMPILDGRLKVLFDKLGPYAALEFLEL